MRFSGRGYSGWGLFLGVESIGTDRLGLVPGTYVPFVWFRQRSVGFRVACVLCFPAYGHIRPPNGRSHKTQGFGVEAEAIPAGDYSRVLTTLVQMDSGWHRGRT